MEEVCFNLMPFFPHTPYQVFFVPKSNQTEVKNICDQRWKFFQDKIKAFWPPCHLVKNNLLVFFYVYKAFIVRTSQARWCRQQALYKHSQLWWVSASLVMLAFKLLCDESWSVFHCYCRSCCFVNSLEGCS